MYYSRSNAYKPSYSLVAEREGQNCIYNESNIIPVTETITFDSVPGAPQRSLMLNSFRCSLISSNDDVRCLYSCHHLERIARESILSVHPELIGGVFCTFSSSSPRLHLSWSVLGIHVSTFWVSYEYYARCGNPSIACCTVPCSACHPEHLASEQQLVRTEHAAADTQPSK